MIYIIDYDNLDMKDAINYLKKYKKNFRKTEECQNEIDAVLNIITKYIYNKKIISINRSDYTEFTGAHISFLKKFVEYCQNKNLIIKHDGNTRANDYVLIPLTINEFGIHHAKKNSFLKPFLDK